MWIVAKYKPNEFKILKKDFFKILGEMPEFYNPKIKYERYIKNKLKVFEKKILDNYVICKHDKFKDRTLVNVLKSSRGLIHFLNGYESNQKELNNFVKFCKSYEDEGGFLKQNFYQEHWLNEAFHGYPFLQQNFHHLSLLKYSHLNL